MSTGGSHIMICGKKSLSFLVILETILCTVTSTMCTQALFYKHDSLYLNYVCIRE